MTDLEKSLNGVFFVGLVLIPVLAFAALCHKINKVPDQEDTNNQLS